MNKNHKSGYGVDGSAILCIYMYKNINRDNFIFPKKSLPELAFLA